MNSPAHLAVGICISQSLLHLAYRRAGGRPAMPRRVAWGLSGPALYVPTLYLASNASHYRVSRNGMIIIGQHIARGEEPKPLKFLNRWFVT